MIRITEDPVFGTPVFTTMVSIASREVSMLIPDSIHK